MGDMGDVYTLYRNSTFYLYVPPLTFTCSGGHSHTFDEQAGVTMVENGAGVLEWAASNQYILDGGTKRVRLSVRPLFDASPPYAITSWRLLVEVTIESTFQAWYKYCGHGPYCNYDGGFFGKVSAGDPVLSDCNPLP
jgi:hypothetical protein